MGKEQSYELYIWRFFLEGGLSFANFTLLNGVFLIGFALTLGASELQIGILMSIPLLANLLQITSAFILERTGTRKWTAVVSLFISRVLWIFIVFAIFGVITFPHLLYLFGAVLFISSILLAVGNLALLSWMKDIVPIAHLGNFWGKRNIYASVCGIIVYLLGSYFLDRFHSLDVYGYLFTAGLFLGLVAVPLLLSVPEKKKPIHAISPPKFFGRLRIPFFDIRFRPLLYFGIFWGFAVNVASPFFIVYLLDDLSLSFLVVSLFLVLDTLFRIYGLNVWRRIVHRFGGKPSLAFAATITSCVPLAFLFVNKDNFLIVPFIFAISAFSYAGIDIGLGQLLFKSSPRKYDAYYLSSFTSLVGLSSALGPILGGFLAVLIPSLKAVFLASFVLRAAALPFISRIHEYKAREVSDIISRMQTLKLVSLFTNIFTVADHAAQVVLIPQKQLFILQRKLVTRLAKDMVQTTALLSKTKHALGQFTLRHAHYHRGKLENLSAKLSVRVQNLDYSKPTVYYKLPHRVHHRLKHLVAKLQTPQRGITNDVRELKHVVTRYKERLDILVEKKLELKK